MMGVILFLAVKAIGLTINAVLLVVNLFVGHIILFDSILLAIAADIASQKLLHIHPAIALVIGIVVLVSFLVLQTKTSVGFWIIGGLFSVVWGAVFALVATVFAGSDTTWSIVIMIFGTLLSIALHISARGRAAA
jgi:hypothetical protein